VEEKGYGAGRPLKVWYADAWNHAMNPMVWTIQGSEGCVADRVKLLIVEDRARDETTEGLFFVKQSSRADVTRFVSATPKGREIVTTMVGGRTFYVYVKSSG
jgi:esterase/lipase superfamily enzyme